MAGYDEDTNILKLLTGITIMSDRYDHGHTHCRQEREVGCLAVLAGEVKSLMTPGQNPTFSEPVG